MKINFEREEGGREGGRRRDRGKGREVEDLDDLDDLDDLEAGSVGVGVGVGAPG